MDITPTTKSSPIPYSQHYRCFPQMIGSLANQAVFMYLMDETIARLKTGKPISFKISANEIANKRNITWRTATSSLNELQTMRVIVIVGDICTVDIDRFTSLIHAFHNLSNATDLKLFTRALQAGNDGQLADLGYVLTNQGRTELLSQKGNSQAQVLLNDTTLCQIAEGSAKWQNSTLEVMSFSRGYAKKQNLPSGVMLNDRSEPSGLCHLAEGSAKWQNLMLKSRSNFANISQIIRDQMSKNDFFEAFYPSCIEVMDENEYSELVDALFLGECEDSMLISPQFGYLFSDLLLSFSRRGLCHLAEEVMSFSRTVNKEINKKKSGPAPSGTCPEKENNEEGEDVFDQVDLSSYKLQKEKLTLPFFPAKQIEEFTTSLANCIDRADKIFINQLWNIATSLVGWNDNQEENGDLTELPVNIEGEVIYADRIMQDLLLPAYEATEEIIQCGFVVVNGETLTITADMISPDDVQKILDWECIGMEDGYNAYKISSSRFHNIHSTPATPNKRQSSRQSRVEDKGYMQKIVLIGDDDNLYSQLTPIELAIYNFLTTHFQISDQGEIVAPLTDYLNRVQLSQSYVQLKEAGLSEDDFLSVLFKNKPSRQDGSLQLKERMFDSGAIRRWNERHGHLSVIETI